MDAERVHNESILSTQRGEEDVENNVNILTSDSHMHAPTYPHIEGEQSEEKEKAASTIAEADGVKGNEKDEKSGLGVGGSHDDALDEVDQILTGRTLALVFSSLLLSMLVVALDQTILVRPPLSPPSLPIENPHLTI